MGYCGYYGYTVGTVRVSGYCTVPTGYCRILWVLWVLCIGLGTAQYPGVLQGTVGTMGAYCTGEKWQLGTAQFPWVLQGTVGTVGTVRDKRDSWVLHSTYGYCRVL
jgi:hypothetical protein